MKRNLMFKFSTLILFLFIPGLIFSYPSSIKGKVVDAKNAKPLPDANIEIVGTSKGAASDEFGEFVIEQIPPGKYTIKVSFIGYKSVQKTVFIYYNETVSLNVFLEPTIIERQSVIITARAPMQTRRLFESHQLHLQH